MSNPQILCLPPIANTLRDLDMRFTWVLLKDKKKNGRKGLSFTVRVYLNLQLRVFTQFREKLFSMQTTKAQISQRTYAVLPIISRKYDS